VKESEKKYFTYKTVKQLGDLTDKGIELYSLDDNMQLNKIVSVEGVSVQEDFWEIRTFSGSKLIVGADTHIFVDGTWLLIDELEFYEKIWEFNIIKDYFHPTYITHIQPYKRKDLAYRIYAENDSGFVMNNFIVRFQGEIIREEYCVTDDNQFIHLTDEVGGETHRES
jgi:hypothetical protein